MKMSARTAIIALASVAMLIHAANAAEIKRSAPKVSSNSNSNSQTAIDHDELFQRSQVESTSFLQTMAKAGAKATWSGEHIEGVIYDQVQFVVPHVYPELSGKRVLTTEFVPGAFNLT